MINLKIFTSVKEIIIKLIYLMSKSIPSNKNKSIMNRNNPNLSQNISVIDSGKEKTFKFEILNLIEHENNMDNLNYKPNGDYDRKIHHVNNTQLPKDKLHDEQNTKPKTYEKTRRSFVKQVNIQNEEEEGWHLIRPKRSARKIKNRGRESPVINTDFDYVSHVEEPKEQIIDDNTDIGEDLKFKYQYKVWVHGDGQDWSTKSFDSSFFIIDSVSSFLQFFNNFHKFDLNTYSFYIMRPSDDGSFIEPTWEHKMNRNGGTCSLRIDIIHGIELLQQLCILMMNECLVPDMSLVNGISISKKTNWALIKIWTKDQDTDISKLLPYAIINSYPSLCIKSKANIPEY